METLLKALENKIGTMDADTLASLESACTVDFADHFAYQTLQSQSFASGRIPLDVSTFLYQTLGGSAESFNRKPLAVRLLAIQLIGRLARTA